MTAECRRATVLALSCVLWSPVVLATLRGEVELGGSLIRLLLAVILSWAAVCSLHRLVSGYGLDRRPDVPSGHVEAAGAEPDRRRRRDDDADRARLGAV